MSSGHALCMGWVWAAVGSVGMASSWGCWQTARVRNRRRKVRMLRNLVIMMGPPFQRGQWSRLRIRSIQASRKHITVVTAVRRAYSPRTSSAKALPVRTRPMIPSIIIRSMGFMESPPFKQKPLLQLKCSTKTFQRQ